MVYGGRGGVGIGGIWGIGYAVGGVGSLWGDEFQKKRNHIRGIGKAEEWDGKGLAEQFVRGGIAIYGFQEL